MAQQLKRTYCFSRGSNFGSQHLLQVAHNHLEL